MTGGGQNMDKYIGRIRVISEYEVETTALNCDDADNKVSDIWCKRDFDDPLLVNDEVTHIEVEKKEKWT